MVRTNLSAYAFKFGDRGGSFADFTPASASVFSNSALPCGLAAALRRWLDPVPFQNVSDRGAGKIVPQIGQRSLDAPIAPPLVLCCQSDHQSLDPFGSARSPRSALGTAGRFIFLRNEFPMPSQQSLWGDNGSDLGQNVLAEFSAALRDLKVPIRASV